MPAYIDEFTKPKPIYGSASNTLCDTAMNDALGQDVVWLDLDGLEPAPWNINEMDGEIFTALLDDMNQKDGPGRINPTRVRFSGSGKYQLIDGHQRVRAAQNLGWKRIRGFVVDCSELDARVWNFRMNHERGNMDPVREAEFFQQMVNRGWSLRKLEKELGIKRQTIQQILRRLKVTSEAADILEHSVRLKETSDKSKVGQFKLAPQHYEAIGGLNDAKLQKELAKAAVEHTLAAHETRKLVSLVKRGMSVDEGLRLIVGGKVEGENVVLFACKKCKTPYHVDWEGKEIKPLF